MLIVAVASPDEIVTVPLLAPLSTLIETVFPFIVGLIFVGAELVAE